MSGIYTIGASERMKFLNFDASEASSAKRRCSNSLVDSRLLIAGV